MRAAPPPPPHPLSVALIKNLTRLAISEVCFIRNLFPSSAFRETYYGDTKIRSLAPRALDDEGKPTGDIVSEGAIQLVAVLESSFEALDQGYLKGLVLGIYSAEVRTERV